MAARKKNTQKPKSLNNAATAQPGLEIGSAASFPATTWEDFAFGRSHAVTKQSGYTVPNAGSAVPLPDLIEMRRRDGQTRALLRLFTLPILSCLADSKWIAPSYGKGAADKEVEFANLMFNLPPQAGGMTTSKDKMLRFMLLAVLEGFSAFEEVRQVPDEGPLKGKVTLRKLAHRNSATVRFVCDDNGGFAGFNQTVTRPNGDVETVHIPKDKALYWACNEEENPFYGVSFFETAWYHYDIKTKLYYIAHIASQFAAVPGRVGTYPQDASPQRRREFAQALANFAFNSSITLPAGFDVKWANNQSGFSFLPLIEHHSHLQAKSVLMSFADTENRMVLIENSSRDASADMYIQALESLMDQIAELFTHHLMPKYIDWNFDSGVYPVFKFGALSDQSKEAMRDLFDKVVVSNVLNCTPEMVREMEKQLARELGLDINYDEIEKHEEEAAKLEAEKQDLQEQLLNMGQPIIDPATGAPAAPDSPPMDSATSVGGNAPPVEQQKDVGNSKPGNGPVDKDENGLTPLSSREYTELIEMATELFLANQQSAEVGLEDALGVSADDDA